MIMDRPYWNPLLEMADPERLRALQAKKSRS